MNRISVARLGLASHTSLFTSSTPARPPHSQAISIPCPTKLSKPRIPGFKVTNRRQRSRSWSSDQIDVLAQAEQDTFAIRAENGGASLPHHSPLVQFKFGKRCDFTPGFRIP